MFHGILAGRAHLSSSSHCLSTSKQSSARVCWWACASGCSSRRQSQVFDGMSELVPSNSSVQHHVRFRLMKVAHFFVGGRYMGKIIGIGDLDPVRWPNSHWRSVKVTSLFSCASLRARVVVSVTSCARRQVSWDEHAVGERQFRVSPWEIEPLPTFPMYPSPFPLGMKHSWPTAVPCHHGNIIYFVITCFVCDVFIFL